jgi:hypothetical protein
MVVNTPVDSTTYSAPALPHGMAFGSLSEKTEIFWPKWKEYGLLSQHKICKITLQHSKTPKQNILS